MMKIRFLSLMMVFFMAVLLAGKQAIISASAQSDPKSSFLVNSNGDAADANPGDGICATSGSVCTLRAAIQEANHPNNVGSHTITFSMSFTITPATNLPTISDDNMVISAITALNPTVTITSGGASNGLSIGANGVRIHRLVISGFTTGILVNGNDNFIGVYGDGVNDDKEGNRIINNSSNGVTISSGLRNQVAGNLIGLDGSVIQPNDNGVRVDAADTIIGTNGDGVGDQWEFNYISGNTANGVHLYAGGTGTIIAGNLIGLTGGGIVDGGNGQNGIYISGANNVRIGTNGDNLSDDWEDNYISGNGLDGIRISTGSGHKVSGNVVGLGVNGSVIGNGGDGIDMDLTTFNSTIGVDGNLPAYSSHEINTISGNGVNGINLAGYQVVVAGNYIGTDMNGVGDRGNVQDGITVSGRNNTIGTDGNGGAEDAVEGNVISGNGGNGIRIAGVDADNAVISGNLIGLEVDGSTILPNSQDGINVQLGPSGTHIGVGGTSTSDTLERNVISGNTWNGISIGSADGATICGNYIGLDKTGQLDRGNTGHGIGIGPGNDSTITIGLPDGGRASLGNTISGNGQSGITIVQSDNHIIAGNRIGTTANGQSAVPNDWDGIYISDSANTRIGTNGDGVTDSIEGNISSGNTRSGIHLFGAGTLNTIVAGNMLGLASNGSIALPNVMYGIQMYQGPSGTRIGTNGDGVSDSLERNAVSANSLSGIYLYAAGSTSISGNYIGTDVDGEQDLGNFAVGVFMEDCTSGVITIGVPNGGLSSYRNLISGNNTGVIIRRSNGHIVAGNWIGLDAYGDPLIPNDLGISLDESTNIRVGSDDNGQTDTAERNVIAGNTSAGIRVEGSTSAGNRFSANSYYMNGGLAIDLYPWGVTANDGMDLDSGPNGLQNHPVVRSVFYPAAGVVRIIGDINSTPSTTFTIQFYASSAPDSSGFGEGEVYLGQASLSTDAGGSASFDQTVAFTLGSTYRYYSALVISAAGNTSEFGPTVEAVTRTVYLPLICR